MNKEGWTYKIFTDCMEKIPHPKQVKTDEYHPIGRYPVVSQEEKTIAGYSDLTEYVYQPPKPIIIFGDHTRVLKYVDFDFIVGADGVKILIPKDDLQTKFLYYYLKWYKIPNLGYSRHFKLLKEINVPVPPLSIQQRIVSELDQLSDIIAMKRKQVEEYDALTQSLFYEMFGDPIINDKGWNVSKLSNVVSFKNGLNFKQSDLGETFKFIGVGDFGEKKFIDCEYLENYVHINETIPSEYFLQDNDIVIVRSNGSKNLVGRGMLVKTGKTRTLYSGFCIRCRISDPNALSPTFLITFLMNRSIKFILRNEGRGANISNINQKMLSNLPIPLPPLPLQHAFADKVRAIERQKQLVNDSIRELQTLLDSRMQEYFG